MSDCWILDMGQGWPIPYELFEVLEVLILNAVPFLLPLWEVARGRGSNYTSINWQCVTAKEDGIPIHVPEKTK